MYLNILLSLYLEMEELLRNKASTGATKLEF
jgi:hypothetical protein